MRQDQWSPHGTPTHEVPLPLRDIETRWLAAPLFKTDDQTKHAQDQAPALAYAEKLRNLGGVRVEVE
jgi:hypothetical protein